MPVWTPQHRPSYKQGYARSAAEAANPGLWKGLVFAGMTSLGPTGLTLRDISGRKNHGTLTNNPTWVKTNKGWALDFDGNGASVAVYDRALSSEEIRQLYADREEE